MATALDLRMQNVVDVLVSEAQRLGIFERVNQHESKSAPGNGFTAEVVWGTGPTPITGRSGLAVTSGRLVYFVRFRLPFLTEPEDSIDALMISAVGNYIAALHTELAFADTVGSTVDVFGMAGVPIDAQGGYLTQDSSTYRIATITVPIIMDDIWAQVN